MAFKAMILLKRRDDLSLEAFAAWWLETHRPLALRLPGLRRMVINLGSDQAALYDGCSELWFDTEADFHAAYATELGQAVARDSLSMVSRRDRLFVREIEAIPERG
ncbi:MAG: EthD family reductase [Hyphomonadaceae bacterium]